MILPGHITASLLCHRYLRADLHVVVVAGLAPDLVDKTLYYGLRCVPNTRVPMHTLLAWVVSTLLVGAIGWCIAHNLRWGGAWFLGYGAHLLCDSPLAGGDLAFLYPGRAYPPSNSPFPLAYLLDISKWPHHALLAELVLVVVGFYLLRRPRRPAPSSVTDPLPNAVHAATRKGPTAQ